MDIERPEETYTISQLIEVGESSDTMTYDKFCIYIKLNSELQVPIKNVLYDYMNELKDMSVAIQLSDKEYNKYKYKPRLLSYDIYGTTDLYYVILMINNIFNEKQFDMKKIKMIRNDDLIDSLSKILNSEENLILNKNTSNLNPVTSIANEPAKTFAQQLMEDYPNIGIDDDIVVDGLACVYGTDTDIAVSVTDLDGNQYTLRENDIITMIIESKENYSELLRITSTTKKITITAANTQILEKGDFIYYITLSNAENNYNSTIVPYSKLTIK